MLGSAPRSLSGVGTVPRTVIGLGMLLALGVLGWALWARPWDRVPLITGVNGCYAGGEQGQTGPLVVDAQYGTRFNGQPVMWPDGFSARHAGFEVEILNRGGQVVATTGRLYHISVAAVSQAEQNAVGSLGAYPAAANCGYLWDLLDCTAAAAQRGEPLRTLTPDGEMYTSLGLAKYYCGLLPSSAPQ